ncbi:MAG: glycine zipper domain-containing protein [Novosphingobium sp.]
MRKIVLSAIAAGSLSLGGCATNYSGEGALAGGAVGGILGANDGDFAEGALLGAAIGAVGGTLIKKKEKREQTEGQQGCWRYDRNGDRFWTDNC